MIQSPTAVAEISLAKDAARPAAGHRVYLDGMRALAALWVVLSHLWIIPCGLDARDDLLGRLTNWTLYSHFAVDVFLVLSGYCLVLPVARDGQLHGGALRFFGRRARRILPPFYASLAISLGVTLAIQSLVHHPLQINTPALAANVFLVQDLFPALNIFNGPFWSIAVEWRIYFLFPVMVWALPQCGRLGVLVLAALASGAGTLALQRLHPDMMLSCPWYLLLFALGLCAGSLSVEQRGNEGRRLWPMVSAISIAGLAVLVHAHPITAIGGADFGAYLPVIDTLAGVGAAALLLTISRSPQRFPLLSWPPLVWLGTFAYSLYLVHMPCLLLFSKLITVYAPAYADPLHRSAALLLTLPLVIGAARLFFLAFEEPFISRRS